MFFDNPMLFDLATLELLRHLAHKITISPYGGDAAPDNIAIELEDCHELLIDFVPESSAGERPDPQHMRYEGHNDAARDVCYVEVIKPANLLIRCRNAMTSSTSPNRNRLGIWRKRPGAMCAGHIARLPRRRRTSSGAIPKFQVQGSCQISDELGVDVDRPSD